MELSQHLRAITLATPSAVSWMQVIWRPYVSISWCWKSYSTVEWIAHINESLDELKSVTHCWKKLWPEAVSDFEDFTTSRM